MEADARARPPPTRCHGAAHIVASVRQRRTCTFHSPPRRTLIGRDGRPATDRTRPRSTTCARPAVSRTAGLPRLIAAAPRRGTTSSSIARTASCWRKAPTKKRRCVAPRRCRVMRSDRGRPRRATRNTTESLARSGDVHPREQHPAERASPEHRERERGGGWYAKTDLCLSLSPSLTHFLAHSLTHSLHFGYKGTRP